MLPTASADGLLINIGTVHLVITHSIGRGRKLWVHEREPTWQMEKSIGYNGVWAIPVMTESTVVPVVPSIMVSFLRSRDDDDMWICR